MGINSTLPQTSGLLRAIQHIQSPNKAINSWFWRLIRVLLVSMCPHVSTVHTLLAGRRGEVLCGAAGRRLAAVAMAVGGQSLGDVLGRERP